MADQGQKKRRLVFTLEEKFKIISEIEAGRKQADLCKERNLSKSTICTIWQNRESTKRAYEDEKWNRKYKRVKRSAHDEVDQALLKWFSQKRKKGLNINGPMLQVKAEEFGKRLEDNDNFKCSAAWIDRFKKRHNIFSGKVSRQSGVIIQETVENDIKDFKEITNIKTEVDDNDELKTTINVQEAQEKVNELVRFLQTRDVPRDILNSCLLVQTCIEEMVWTNYSANS